MSVSKKLWRALVVRPVKKRIKKYRSRRQALKRATNRARKVTTARKAAPAKRTAPRATSRPRATPQAATPRARTPRSASPKAAPVRGANRLNVIRQWERTAATIDSNRAASLQEKNALKVQRAEAKAARDAEIARRRAERKAKRDERVARAEDRLRARTSPPAVQVMKAPVTQRRSTPEELNRARPQAAPQPSSAKCGATCDDGTPCQNPSLGQTCAAGHNPTSAKKKAGSYRDNWATAHARPQRHGEKNGDYLQSLQFEAARAKVHAHRARHGGA